MNILQSLANQAKQRKDQLVHDIAQAPAAVGQAVSNVQPAGVVRQINPFDNGQTYKQAAPVTHNSFIQQATHNGVTNLAGGLVQHVPQFAVDLSNVSANLGTTAHNKVFGTNIPRQTPQQQFNDPLTRSITRVSGATGTNRQLIGSGAQVGLDAFTGGLGKTVSKGVEAIAPKVLPKIIPKVVANGITGGIVGGPYSVAQTVAGTQPLTAHNLAGSFKQGAGAGAILGAGGTIAAPLAGKAIKSLPGVSQATTAATKTIAPKLAQVAQAGAQNATDAFKPAKQFIRDNRNITIQQKELDRQHAGLLAQQERVPVDNAIANNQMASKISYNRAQHDALEAQRPSMKQLLPNQSGYAKIPGSGEGPTPLERAAQAKSQKNVDSSEGSVTQPKTAPVQSTKPELSQSHVAEAVPQTPASTGTQLADESSLPQRITKTGIADKHLDDLHAVRKQILSSEADDILANHNVKLPSENLYQKVLHSGGISTKSADFAELPNSVRRNNGSAIDQVAQELGYPDEHALYDDLLKYRDRPQPMTREQSKEIARQNLENGTSPYSQDWQDVHTQIGQRQAELSRYPQGTRQQVKVLDKPAPMSDAELQSLSRTPEGMAPKQGNDVLQRNDKQVLRNPDAERQVQEVLTKGGTTDEALHAYMKATGADLQTAVRDVRRVAADSNLGFTGGKNPLEGTVKVPTVQAGDADQAFLNADYVKQHEHGIGSDALKAFHGLSDHDKTLLQDIETDTVPNVARKADNPQAFADAEKAIRTYYDTRHAYDKYLDIDVGYRQNYLRQLFAKAEDTAATADQTPLKAGNKRPGYTKERSKDTLHTEVGNALERDINGASANHARLAYAKGLGEAFPGQVNDSGQLVRDASGNHLQLTNRYGQGLTANKDIANQLNRRTWTPDTNKALATYDKANAGIKYVKLGGGAFHASTEAGNFVGQQIASGKILTNPSASGKVLKTFFSPKTMSKEMAGFKSSGTLDKAALAGLKVQPHEILADANVKLGGKISKYSGIQALHDATFAREIPYAKLKMFEQGTEGLDPHNPADMKVMRQKSREINQIFGGINRDVQGITPGAFKRLQRFVLATDFTESKIHTAFDAVTDFKSPAGKLARQTVIGKALLFAGLAAVGGAVGGEFQGKSPQETARNILGKLADPSFGFGKYKVGLPATHISEFTKPITPLFRTDGGDRFSGLQRYGTNRLAAIPSEVLQLRTNKDATGARIYGKDYKANGGQRISAAKTGLNIASGFAPIPAAQAVGVGEGKTPLAAAIANTIGLRVNDPSSYGQKSPSAATSSNDTIKAAFNSSEGKAFIALSDAEKKAAAQTDPKARDLYNQYQAMKTGLKQNTTLRPIGLDPGASKVLDHYERLTPAAKAQVFDRKPGAEYEYNAAKYAQDKANGLSQAEDIRRQATLAKDKVGSTFDKQTRDLYGLSKNEVYDLITTDNNGKKIASDLLAYGDALRAATGTQNKFRTSKGAESFQTAARGGSSSGSKKALSTLLAEFKTPYSDEIKNASKGASLARSAHLAKKSA